MATSAEGREGRECEVERVYRAEYSGLYRYARRILRDPEEAYDLVQDAFLRLHEFATQPGSQPPSRALLYTVARNLAIDRMRRSRTRTRFIQQHDVPSAPIPVSPEAGLLAQEQLDLLKQAMECLDPRDFECLTLREAGLSYAEIGQVLDMPPGSVGPTLVRSLAKVRKAFQALEQPKGKSGSLPEARSVGLS